MHLPQSQKNNEPFLYCIHIPAIFRVKKKHAKAVSGSTGNISLCSKHITQKIKSLEKIQDFNDIADSTVSPTFKSVASTADAWKRLTRLKSKIGWFINDSTD